MRPEPIELPKETSTASNPPDLVTSSQYGFHADSLHTADPYGHFTYGSTASAGSSTSQSPSEAELQGQLRRLISDPGSETRSYPSFHRISEYENASSPSLTRKPNHGPGFTVVRKPGSALSGPQLENFPNGNYPCLLGNAMF
jgi:hypothetical protein